MPNYTQNYNLVKPQKSENYDIDKVTNQNMDIIDVALNGKVSKVNGKDLSTNDFTNGYKKKIDRMVEGSRGFSAYEIAVLNGFTGTAEEWLASLKGDKGDTGGVNSINGQQGDLLLEELLPKEQTYTEIITEEKEIITLPFWYKVGADMLRVRYTGQLLTKASSFAGEDGYYLEITEKDTIGEEGSWSNKIQSSAKWTWLKDAICFVEGKGVLENEPSAL